ncbi:hypothetical protein COMA2_30159 [Candidatus Nitrospira nitrificans]|uniref:Uncharacterized protein n=1 Tax=Candidatus Nitrospira nitrificans TaxID=1742973 RepID=A0A0S4LMX5_9BACT|nr:hypothetical protein COMA2_30159 [Candidatus Nitrospira nitrificans]
MSFCLGLTPALRRVGRGLFEQLMDQGLVGLPALCRHLPQLIEQCGGYPNGNQLFGHAAGRSPDSTHAPQLLIGSLRDIGKINLRVGHMLGAPCDSTASR